MTAGVVMLTLAGLLLALAAAYALHERRERSKARQLASTGAGRAELGATVKLLNTDELAVVCWVAVRLAAGRHAYGELRLGSDGRRFTVEAGQEAVDALAYLAMAALQQQLANAATVRPPPGDQHGDQ